MENDGLAFGGLGKEGLQIIVRLDGHWLRHVR